MPEEVFWGLTPRLLMALMERRHKERKEADYRVGVLCALAANMMRGKDKAPFYPADFFPWLDGPREALGPEETVALMGELIAEAREREGAED